MNNICVTYSLLAHINDNSEGISDFSDIFLPIVKKGITELRNSGITRDSSLIQLREKITEIYSLEIPFPLLRKFVAKIAKEENRHNRKNFQFFANDGSYIINEYIFDKYDEDFIDQKVWIELIEREYGDFLDFLEVDREQVPINSIFEFIDQNRMDLASFFNKEGDYLVFNDDKFFFAAEFVKECKTHESFLFKILKDVYIGSVIASYLESDFKDVSNREIEFVLDTNVIVSLLDLNSVESYNTCHQILKVGKKLGFKFSILDIHLQETKNLIVGVSDQLRNGSTSDGSQYLGRPDSILSACNRRDLTSSDLVRIASNLEKYLNEELGVFFIHKTEKYQNMAIHSQDYKKLQKIRKNKYSAKKDATALEYVRTKRGNKRSENFYEINCWILTASKTELTFLFKDGFLPEIIRSDDLVNVLWLSNPNVNSESMSEIGLTKLISTTLNDLSPSSKVISDFEKNIEKVKGEISEKDCLNVAFFGVKKTIVNLDEVNKIAKKSNEEFVNKIKSLAAKVQQKIDKPHVFGSHTSDLAQIKESMLSTEEYKLKNELKEKKDLVYELNNSIKPLIRIENSIQKDSISHAKAIFIIFPIVFFLILFLFILLKGWDTMEVYTYLLSTVFLLGSYLLGIITSKSWNPQKFYIITQQYLYEKKSYNRGFDLKEYDAQKQRIELLKNRISELEKLVQITSSTR